jgi:NAD dependent epimerase/dehydratase
MSVGSTRALVTGADGFIGSHLVEMLLARGWSVRALVQYNSFNHWGWMENITATDALEIVAGDVRDMNVCRSITQDIDVVFHLAALIAIPYSYRAPESYVDVNIKGTLNICQACLDNKVARLLHTSTSEVYGTARYTPIDEKHPLQPQSPYSASKIAADAMAASYRNAFELPLTIVRPFNTYGPRQSARAVIPTVISQIAAGRASISIGDIAPTRDFNFVADTCAGFIGLAESTSAIGQTVNIGSNTEISIGDTITLIKKIMNSNVEITLDPQRIRPVNSEVQRLVCDNSLLRSLINYRPKFSLEEGLRQTIDWFTCAGNLEKYKAGIYNV